MPGPQFFRNAGLFTLPDFLPPEFTAELKASMMNAPKEQARIAKSGGEYNDERVRKVQSCTPPKALRTALKERLGSLIPQLVEHFHLTLDGCEPAHYLIYRPGDFFKPHSDGGRRGADEFTQKRRVSAVIFLNSESAEPMDGAYGDGRLTFHGVLPGPQWERCAFALQPEPGLLIAFPSEMLHEVTPVSHGERFTIATWFYGPAAEAETLLV